MKKGGLGLLTLFCDLLENVTQYLVIYASKENKNNVIKNTSVFSADNMTFTYRALIINQYYILYSASFFLYLLSLSYKLTCF